MVGRPVGSKDSYKRDYTMSPDAWHQRVSAWMRTPQGSSSSYIMDNVVKRFELSAEETEALADEKIRLWKKLGTPALFIADEFINLRTYMNAKLMKGLDPTSKEFERMSRLFLDFMKEYNRLTQVSAKDQLEVFTKNFASEKNDFEYVVEVEKNESEPSEEVQ